MCFFMLTGLQELLALRMEERDRYLEQVAEGEEQREGDEQEYGMERQQQNILVA